MGLSVGSATVRAFEANGDGDREHADAFNLRTKAGDASRQGGVCRPKGPGELVGENVFVGAREGERLKSAPYRPKGTRFSKFGLFVSKGQAALLSTEEGIPVRMAWNTRKPKREITVVETDSGEFTHIPTTDHCSDDWRFFAGGLVFRGRHCATVHVESGVSRDLRYGLRASCD